MDIIKLPHFSGFKRATDGSAGFDIEATEDVMLYPDGTFLMPSGFKLDLGDRNIAGLIIPRSGLGFKKGVILGNGTGLIDQDYQGEVFVTLWNRSEDPYVIKRGERIAQMFFVPFVIPTFTEVDEFVVKTVRGESGLGGTGR